MTILKRYVKRVLGIANVKKVQSIFYSANLTKLAQIYGSDKFGRHNFTKVYETKNIVNENYDDEEIKNFKKNLDGIEARFIKVFAKNMGTCPPWHIGAGGKAWVFIDEITVE